MRYNVLGNSGLFVSEMCLGTMVFGPSSGRYAGAGDVGQDDVDRIVRRAFDAGINFIDTANVYAGGQSEELIGRSLENLGIARHEVVIATKVEHATGSGPNDGGASRYHIVDQLKKSLRRLGTDHIDLYQLHGWDPATPVEETVRALDDLVRQGHVRYVGVSNWAAWQVTKALGVAARLNAVPFQSVQAYYSLVGRELERELVPMLQTERLGLLVYSPLAGGYLLQQRVVTSVILGVKRLDQLEEHLKALEVRLSEDDLETLNAASALSLEYPAWMVQTADAARTTLLKTGGLPEQR